MMVESTPQKIDWEKVQVIGGVKLTKSEREVLNETVNNYMSRQYFGKEFVADALGLDRVKDKSFITQGMSDLVILYTRVALTQWFAAVISNRVPHPGSLAIVRKRLLELDNDGVTKVQRYPDHDVAHSIAALKRRTFQKKRRARGDDAVPMFVTSGAPGTLLATLGVIMGISGPTGADHEREEILAQVYHSYKAREHAQKAQNLDEFIRACTVSIGAPALLRSGGRYTSDKGANAWFYTAMKEFYEAYRNGGSAGGRFDVAKLMIEEMEQYMRDVVPSIAIPQWRT